MFRGFGVIWGLYRGDMGIKGYMGIIYGGYIGIILGLYRDNLGDYMGVIWV